MVYVALSRVTSPEGLYIVSAKKDPVFHHGRRTAAEMTDLKLEFARLDTNRLCTAEDTICNFIRNNNYISILTLNCQSLRAHYLDLTDKVTQECHLLLLSETNLNNDEQVNIPQFEWCIQFKRVDRSHGGVAIYKNQNSTQVITPHMTIVSRQTTSMGVSVKAIGDICTTEVMLENGQTLLLVVVYISPNQRVQDIMKYIHFVLLPYTPAGSALLGENYDKLPMIMSGDFNKNFNDPEAQPLIEFLQEKFGLQMNSNRTQRTTQHGTTIDAVFKRGLDTLQTKIYASYFSYHESLISCLPKISEPSILPESLSNSLPDT
jgi:hypothetical protein